MTADIGWWAHQDDLSVGQLEVSVLAAPLTLFNNRALLRFRVIGEVSYPKGGWRPYIKATHISERFAQGEDGGRVGDIEISPIVGVSEDADYHGERIKFDYKVEKLVETFAWGPNHYRVRTDGQEQTFELHQRK